MERQFNGWVFALQVYGACIWKGLYMEGLISELYGNLLLPTLHLVDVNCTRDSCIVLHHLHCTHKILCIMYLSRP